MLEWDDLKASIILLIRLVREASEIQIAVVNIVTERITNSKWIARSAV